MEQQKFTIFCDQVVTLVFHDVVADSLQEAIEKAQLLAPDERYGDQTERDWWHGHPVLKDRK